VFTFYPNKVPAYGTWVSEIMLQQTRVETVIDYFSRWMRAFPTPQALAAAPLEAVNAQWAGLGYYRRARFLHEGAKALVADHGGQLPGTAKRLLAIPGIGRYTAGAVASIAFGLREPVVDGNVIRVLSRLRALPAPAKDKRLADLCWALQTDLLAPDRPGDFNQATMELGATLCTPKAPRCGSCPLRRVCRARAEGGAAAALRYPAKATKKPPKEETLAVCVVQRVFVAAEAAGGVEDGEDDEDDEDDEDGEDGEDGEQGGQFLCVQRPSGAGLLAGQWELLCAKVPPSNGSLLAQPLTALFLRSL
jgi:A/G-specific adenine glycosylase